MRFCRLMLILGALVLVMGLVALIPSAHAADAARVAAAKQALQLAINKGSADGILAARGQFDALSVSEPKNALFHSWVATCDWRVAPLLMGEATKAKGKRWVQEGIDRANRAYELDPKFAEALALRCGLQGMSIQYDPSQGMRLGIQMGADMAYARDLAPKNPRVALLDGINTLYTPAFVGGGADKSYAKLVQAQALFAAETVTDPTAPDWGKDDVYVWSGRAAMKGGNFKDARDAYQKALAANPDNGWVKHWLLPEAEKKLAAE
jgi:tetratricopeptide (TPR) repeat protein